jgi:hypothetical protein
MNTTLCILALVIVFSFLFGYKTVEGFNTYQECRDKGFTKSFCVQTPVAAVGVGSCQCEDGSLGLILPGFRGSCLCGENLRVY